MCDDGVSDSMILHFYQSTRGPEDNKCLSGQRISLWEGSPISKHNLPAVDKNVPPLMQESSPSMLALVRGHASVSFLFTPAGRLV